VKTRLLVLAAALALSGCVATQRDVLDLSAQMDDMKLKMSQLQGTMESLQKNQADLLTRMDQMQGSMTSLNENLGDFNQQLSKLKSRWDDLEVRVDGRMKSVQETVQKKQAEETAALPGRTFQDAELNLFKQNYDLAVQGFNLYLKLSPSGELADQAYYHIGEARFGKKEFDAAAKSFAIVLDRWPQSRLTAASRLRYALSLLAMPNSGTDEAERYLESVVEDYPHSAEATAAQEHLDGLKKAKAKEAAKKAKEAKKSKRSKAKAAGKKAAEPEGGPEQTEGAESQ
jgi:TolA-binding protein